MSLISCPECGSEISDLAVSCPQCGCKNQTQEQLEEIYDSESSKKQYLRKFNKKPLIISISATLLIILGLAIFLYSQANPPLSKSEKEIFNTAEESYQNKEYLLAYSLYAQLPDYEKAVKRMDSIGMPFDGTWICNTGISVFGSTFYFQYYFGEGDIYLALTSNGTPLLSKTSFLSLGTLNGKLTLESLSCESGTILLSYKNTDGNVANFKVVVKSNDRFIMTSIGSDPKVFDYSRTN